MQHQPVVPLLFGGVLLLRQASAGGNGLLLAQEVFYGTFCYGVCTYCQCCGAQDWALSHWELRRYFQLVSSCGS